MPDRQRFFLKNVDKDKVLFAQPRFMAVVNLIKFDREKNGLLVEQREVQGGKGSLIEYPLSNPSRFLIRTRKGVLENYYLYNENKYLVYFTVTAGVDDSKRIRPEFGLIGIEHCFDGIPDNELQTNEPHDPE